MLLENLIVLLGGRYDCCAKARVGCGTVAANPHPLGNNKKAKGLREPWFAWNERGAKARKVTLVESSIFEPDELERLVQAAQALARVRRGDRKRRDLVAG